MSFACYAVQKHVFDSNNESLIVSCHSDKTDAILAREEIAFGYVQEKDGENKNISTFTDTEFASKKTSLPYGHYVTRDAKEDFYRLSVWHKYQEKIPGKIYGNYVVDHCDKLFNVSLVVLPTKFLPTLRECDIGSLNDTCCDDEPELKFTIARSIPQYCRNACVKNFIEEHEICEEDLEEVSYFHDTLRRTRAFDRICRWADSDTPRAVSVKRLRYDFGREFTPCSLAEKYVPENISPVSSSDLVDAIKARHAEMQKKKDLEKED